MSNLAEVVSAKRAWEDSLLHLAEWQGIEQSCREWFEHIKLN